MKNYTVKKKGNIKERFVNEMKKNWILYAMLVPVILYFVIFKFMPMYGVQLAFKDYNAKLGITGSEWVGLEHFQRFMKSYNFKNLLKNTLTLSVYNLITSFPLAILFALLLNYLRNLRLKKLVQMVSYAPHFISTVVICGMLTLFLAPNTGIFNIIIELFGGEQINFLGNPDYFKHIYTWSGVWQSIGWNSIIYISALAGVDATMHEAAIVEGATIWQRMWYIDLPSIKPTIAMLLILQMGTLMNVGFEKVYLLQNSLNSTAASVLSTYTYELGLIKSDYGFSTAVNLFNTLINIILVLGANYLSKKLADESLI